MRIHRHLLWCAAWFVACPVHANLLANGSFESPRVPTGAFTNFGAGSTAIAGWTVVGVDSAVVDGGFMNGGVTFQAQDGDQWIDLAGVTSNSNSSGVSQSIATIAGQSYLLGFHVGSANNGSNYSAATVELSINGNPRTPYFNPTAPSNMLHWRSFTVSFIAAGNSTNLTFYNGSASTNFLCGLDNVSLVAGSGVTGDFDLDGDVDGNDVLVWQRGGSPTPNSPGDLAAWKGNFGFGSAVAASAAVPEPTSCLLAAASIAAAALRPRRTGRSTRTVESGRVSD